MPEFKTLTHTQEIGAALKAGLVLCALQERLLVQYRQAQVHVQSSQYHFVTSLPEFFDLYQGYTFYIYTQDAGINEDKDREYYTWARWHQ